MDDLDRTMRSLECDIAAEEERAGIFDRADVAYPVLAVALATRRDNLKVTIASLAKGLATIGDGHPDNKLDRLERALADEALCGAGCFDPYLPSMNPR